MDTNKEEPMNNQETKEHRWVGVDEDGVRCADCDCRFGGRWHDLPCGTTEEGQ